MANDLFYRSFGLKLETLDESNREVPVSFSSEEPVRRWFGDEFLLHGDSNVDLSRLNSMGAALLNHNPSMIIGPLRNAEIKDRRGQVIIGFDDDDDGNRAMGKVKSGSLRGVSVGYRVYRFKELVRDEEWTDPDTGRSFVGPAEIATKWEPIEVSLTPVPADATVGVGRSITRSLDGISIERTKTEDDQMDEKEFKKLQEEVADLRSAMPKTEDIVTAVRAAMTEDAKPKPQVDLPALAELRTQARAVSPECESEVVTMYTDGKTENEMLRAINAASVKTADTNDNGDGPGGGKVDSEGKQVVRSINDIPDETFMRSMTGTMIQ